MNETAVLNQVQHRIGEANRAVTEAWSGLLRLIRECDTDESYPLDYPTTAAWLKWNLGLAPATARKWVRIARHLGDYPHIETAFQHGEISFDQVELLLHHVTPETETELLGLACRVDITELKTHLKALTDEERAQEIEQQDETPPEPLLRTWWVDDVLHINGLIPGADGVAVETSLMRLATKAPKDPISGTFRDYDTRMGEALIQMASESLAEDRDHDRATIIIHIPAAEILAQHGAGWDAARRFFDQSELQRLLCDSRIQPAVHNPNGVTVGVGRVRRSIDPWLRRLVLARDGSCRFPGCDRTRWLQIHHQQQWKRDKGPTNLDNLLALCGFHHRLIHRQNWQIHGDPNQHLTFLNQHGRVHQPTRTQNPNQWTDLHLHLITDYTKHKLTQIAARPPP